MTCDEKAGTTPTECSITLRPLEVEDLDFLADLANDPGVRENVVDWGWPVSRSLQERWFYGPAQSSNTFRFVVLNENEERIGVGILSSVDWRNRSASVGLKIGGPSAARGKGYGALVVNALTEFAFQDMGLHKVHASILASNRASQRVFVDKCGWSVEGIRREHVWRHGRYDDVVEVGILVSQSTALSTPGTPERFH